MKHRSWDRSGEIGHERSVMRKTTPVKALFQPAAGGPTLLAHCRSLALGALILTVLACFPAGGAAQGVPPEQLYSEGTAFLERGNWAEAASRFEAVLEVEPDHIPSWFSLAVALEGSGDGPRAIEAYREVLARDDQLFEARMNLAILLHQAGDAAGALEQASHGALLRPGDPVPVLYGAELLDQLGQIEEAEQAYRAVIALDSRLPAPHRRLGSLYRRTGRADAAYDAFLEAARLGAGESSVFVSLGDIAVEQERFAAARDHYRMALGLEPDDPEIGMRLALVFHELGAYSEAIAILTGLGNQEPVLAETYLAAGRFDEAANLYEALVASEPGNVDYWLGLGRAYYELGRLPEAIRTLERAVGMAPDHAEAWAMLAGSYYQQDDFENAAAMLLKRLELLPDDAHSHFLLATALDRMQNAEQALLHYNRFLELDDGTDDVRTFQVRQRAELLERLLDE